MKITLKKQHPYVGYVSRIERVERLVHDAELISDSLSPDFWIDKKEPGFKHRSRVQFALRKLKEEVKQLKEVYLKLGL